MARRNGIISTWGIENAAKHHRLSEGHNRLENCIEGFGVETYAGGRDKTRQMFKLCPGLRYILWCPSNDLISQPAFFGDELVLTGNEVFTMS